MTQVAVAVKVQDTKNEVETDVEQLVNFVAEKALTTKGVGVLTNNTTYEALAKGVLEYKEGAVQNIVRFIRLASTDKEYLDAFERKLKDYKCIIIDQRNNHFLEYELLKLMKKAKLRGIEVHKVTKKGFVEI